MKTLNGRVAVVTGAAGGIGKGLAQVLAGEGVAVMLADVEEETLAKTVAELEADGARVAGCVTDVADAASVRALADATLSAFGAAHIVCNNAGVSGMVNRSWTAPTSDWEWVFGVNVWGVIHGIQTFLPILLEQEEGHVVNTGSAACFESLPGMAAYGASKHAVLAISEALHREMSAMQANVGVTVLIPGGTVNTRIMQSERNWPTALGPIPEPDPNPVSQFIKAGFAHAMSTGSDPRITAEPVIDAIKNNAFMVCDEPDLLRQWAQHPTQLGEGVAPTWPPT